MSLVSNLRQYFSARPRSLARDRRRRLALSRSEFFEGLEDRQLLATVSASGTTLNIALNVASQQVAITSSGTSYRLVLSGGATNTWSGSATGTSASTATLTVSSTGLSTYNTINITDTANGAGVTFNTSGTNAYSDAFNITLNGGSTAGDMPAAVTFNGTSSFNGTNALNVTTTRNIAFASGSSLSTLNGNLTLKANVGNTAAAGSTFGAAGVDVNNATVQVTGTGLLDLRGRGGEGSNAAPYGVQVQARVARSRAGPAGTTWWPAGDR